MEKTLKSINVKNLKKVARYIGIEPRIDPTTMTAQLEADLLKDPHAKDFVKKYEKYFTTTDKKLLREFYDQTGLILMNVFSRQGFDVSSQYLTMYGFLKEPHETPHNAHLVAYITTDSHLKLAKEDYYEHDYDKDEPWGFSEEALETLRQNPEFVHTKEFERCYKYGPRTDFVGSFGEHFVLKDGSLYRDDQKIEENLRAVFRLNDATIYLIFNDNTVEFLEYKPCETTDCQKYDKIIYDINFIARLKDQNLSVIKREENAEFNYDTTFDIQFTNVDDIEYELDNQNEPGRGTLKLISGKNYIGFPIYDYQPYVRDYCG